MARPNDKTSVTRMDAAEREIQAVNLKRNGATFAQIGKSMGITPQRAFQIVKKAMERLVKQREGATESLRQMELERLDGHLRALAKQAGAGHIGAIQTSLRVSERRAKLLGLDVDTHNQILTGDITVELIAPPPDPADAYPEDGDASQLVSAPRLQQ